MTNSRRAAAFAVARWLMTKDDPAALLPAAGDRAFVQDLVYTVIRRLRPLRRILGEFVARWPKGELEALLYVGAAQILYMPSVPDFAAVNETVEAAKTCANKSVAKVVNGVLRNLLRRRAEIESELAAASVEEREGYPNALYRRWVERFGAENAERLAGWHNRPAETFLAYPDGRFVKLERGRRVTEVEGYAEGAFIVQNPATALAVSAVDAQAGMAVLDACAAPGGKTIQLAWRGACVTACEVNPKRRRRLAENLVRLHLDGRVKVVEDFAALGDQAFDRVLVDAPCSNTGVLRRRPDARWNWSEEKLSELVKLQREILDAVAPHVKVGGLLVYSTCSNDRAENDDQVNEFLSRHPGFVLVGADESFPFEASGEQGHDGAYAAALKRNI